MQCPIHCSTSVDFQWKVTIFSMGISYTPFLGFNIEYHYGQNTLKCDFDIWEDFILEEICR